MIKISTGVRTGLLLASGIRSMFEGGIIRLYGGTPPLSADLPAPAYPLAEITQDGEDWLPYPNNTESGLQFDMIQAAVLTKWGTWTLNGKATGTATWFRLYGPMYDYPPTTDYLVPRLDGLMGVNLLLPAGNYAVTPETTYELDMFQLAFMPFL